MIFAGHLLEEEYKILRVAQEKSRVLTMPQTIAFNCDWNQPINNNIYKLLLYLKFV